MADSEKVMLPEIMIVDIPGKGRQYVQVLNTSSTLNSQVLFQPNNSVNVVKPALHPSPRKMEQNNQRSDNFLQVSSFNTPLAQTSSLIDENSDETQSDEVEHNFVSPEKRHGKGETASVSPSGKGCNCKRSGCSNKYCECFKTNVSCSRNCNCSGKLLKLYSFIFI